MFRLKMAVSDKIKTNHHFAFSNTVFEKVSIIPRQGINPRMILYVLAQKSQP